MSGMVCVKWFADPANPTAAEAHELLAEAKHVLGVGRFADVLHEIADALDAEGAA